MRRLPWRTAKRRCAVRCVHPHGIVFPANCFRARELAARREFFSREIFGKRGKSWSTGLPCRLARRTAKESLPSGLRLPCAFCLFCRAGFFAVRSASDLPCGFLCRDCFRAPTANNSLPCSVNLEAHGKKGFTRERQIFR